MRKVITTIALIIIITACKKNELPIQQQEESSSVSSKKTPPPPPANANPVFAFKDNKKINNQLWVPAIFVMDVTGANVTAVYTNYSGQGNNVIVNRPDYPAWSGEGTQLCFTLNEADLYTLNFSLVNGVPTGTNATIIGDGVAAGGNYKQGKWRPGANQIACVWKKNSQMDQIHLLPSTGGTASVLYTAASADWVIEDDIAFKSDGTNLVFSEKQISTDNVFLKVLDVNTGTIIKSIDLSQYKQIKEVDWAKSPGSNIVALTTRPRCDATPVGRSGMHQLHTIDVGAASPTLIWLRNDIGNISWKGDDTQIAVNAGLWRVSAVGGLCAASGYFGLGIYTIATNGYTLPSYSQGDHADWKR